jgi:hypothetical protein
VRSGDFLLNRSTAGEIYVPFADCHVEDGQVRLNVRSDETENQGWMMAQPIETQRKR